ncbi:DVU_1556 family methyltransferase [Desulfitobacterium hafniense]|uniref:Methyltransferase type 11 domain-containing protein n=1 Tax=Desulfitobacterium hafniense (strain Y51) TaxID=138119 RepID=Q24Z79_DESHY|nr:class I SAM-dependent methyltransferase [Desulfitobacterium hafniense]BAE82663.1 hypothetical protein DSY0874 [Desulfitobacterium hafniense Y51]
MNYYECAALRAVTGETVRPGSFRLTKRAIEFCGLEAGNRLLDVGCGTGASVEFCIKDYRLAAIGIDPSPKMLELGIKRWAELPITQGRAESLAFPDQSIDTILSECCLCHYTDIGQALQEFYRVMSAQGWLIISDLYIRKDNLRRKNVKATEFSSFMKMETVQQLVAEYGFEVVLAEDHTEELKRLSIELIMKYGSVENFWNIACKSCRNCCFNEVSKGGRLGYYLLIAQKND